MIHIRPAAPADTGAMATLLNAIITEGGTTAKTAPVSPQLLLEWMVSGGDLAAWCIAEDDSGTVLGFQWVGPHDALPDNACDIATFVQVGQTGLGIGSKLFNATRAAATSLGYAWINANIRADNSGGLAYYQSRGFETYRHVPNVALEDGTLVEKIYKRFNL